MERAGLGTPPHFTSYEWSPEVSATSEIPVLLKSLVFEILRGELPRCGGDTRSLWNELEPRNGR